MLVLFHITLEIPLLSFTHSARANNVPFSNDSTRTMCPFSECPPVPFSGCGKPYCTHRFCRLKASVWLFSQHMVWLSLHRGPPDNVLIRRTVHLSSVVPANDSKESMFGHRIFFSPAAGSNPWPLALKASALTTSYHASYQLSGLNQDQDSLLVKRRYDNHSPGPVIRELVPSSHQRSELSYTILCIFSGWDQRIGEDIPIPDSLGRKATFINIFIGNGSLKCHRVLISTMPSLGIRSFVGTLALPSRPLYSNISLLFFLLFLRDSHFNVQECQSYSQFHNCNYLSQIWQRAFARFLILPGALHLGGPEPNCHNPGLGAPILYKLPLLPPGGKNISFSSGIQGFC